MIKHRPPWRTSLDHRVVFSLTLIILTCVIGVVFITSVNAFVHVSEDGHDEVVTMMGQIASTAIGALAGYFTANLLHRSDLQEADTSEDKTD